MMRCYSWLCLKIFQLLSVKKLLWSNSKLFDGFYFLGDVLIYVCLCVCFFAVNVYIKCNYYLLAFKLLFNYCKYLILYVERRE